MLPFPPSERALAASAFFPDAPPRRLLHYTQPTSEQGRTGCWEWRWGGGEPLDTCFSTPFSGLWPPKPRHVTLNMGTPPARKATRELFPSPATIPLTCYSRWSYQEFPLKFGTLQPSGEPLLTGSSVISFSGLSVTISHPSLIATFKGTEFEDTATAPNNHLPKT